MRNGAADWISALLDPGANVSSRDRPAVLAALALCGPLSGQTPPIPSSTRDKACFGRILELAPCLYAQVDRKISARGVVHLCELTLGTSIVSANVFGAFQIQHPSVASQPFAYPPRVPGAGGGDIMEALCAEVLANHGLPAMKLDTDGWPVWSSRAHLSLNGGKMNPLKLYGDILLPAAPHNILVSVKSEAARERFIVSGNRLESIGFGFFNEADEFWTVNRMNLLKRWGFVAVYMPQKTLTEIADELSKRSHSQYAININGRPLYRPLESFGADMARVAGRLTIDL